MLRANIVCFSAASYNKFSTSILLFAKRSSIIMLVKLSGSWTTVISSVVNKQKPSSSILYTSKSVLDHFDARCQLLPESTFSNPFFPLQTQTSFVTLFLAHIVQIVLVLPCVYTFSNSNVFSSSTSEYWFLRFLIVLAAFCLCTCSLGRGHIIIHCLDQLLIYQGS